MGRGRRDVGLVEGTERVLVIELGGVWQASGSIITQLGLFHSACS